MYKRGEVTSIEAWRTAKYIMSLPPDIRQQVQIYMEFLVEQRRNDHPVQVGQVKNS